MHVHVCFAQRMSFTLWWLAFSAGMRLDVQANTSYVWPLASSMLCITITLLFMAFAYMLNRIQHCHKNPQGWTLLLIGPFLDRYVSSSWVFDFTYSIPAIMFLALSCSMAVFVNISQFMCLGRFSAVSFQVQLRS